MPVLNVHVKPTISNGPETGSLYEYRFEIPYKHSLREAICAATDRFTTTGNLVVFEQHDDPEQLLAIGAHEITFQILTPEMETKGELVLTLSD